MEHEQVRKLLDRYFEGMTSLAEEEVLRKYFLSNDYFSDDLMRFKPLFVYQQKAQREKFQRRKQNFRPALWFTAVAACLTFIVLLSPPKKSHEFETISALEQEELMETYQLFKSNLEAVSLNYNRGARNISYLTYWNETTNKLLK